MQFKAENGNISGITNLENESLLKKKVEAEKALRVMSF